MKNICQIAVFFLIYMEVNASKTNVLSEMLKSVGAKVHHSENRQSFTLEPIAKQFSKVDISPKDLNAKSSISFMLELYNNLKSGLSLVQAAGRRNLNQADLTMSDTIRSFSPKGYPSKAASKNSKMQFQVPLIPSDESLKVAELRFKDSFGQKHKSRKSKFIFDIKKGNKTVMKLKIRKRPLVHGRYLVFDITQILRPWINGFHRNVTINIRLPKRIIKRKQQPTKLPLMMVFYLENNNSFKELTKPLRMAKSLMSQTLSRVKRSATENMPRHHTLRGWRKAKRQQCQLYDFEVDFKTIGWGEWIIHPTQFNAKACHGKCSSRNVVQNKQSNHAVLQSLMRSVRKDLAPAPCCVPTKLEPLSIMYFEYGEVVVRHHVDMIATECGCR